MEIIKSKVIGKTSKGDSIKLYTISSPNIKAEISSLGATIVKLFVKNKDGIWTDIVLGYDTAQEYFENKGYLGATIGRYAGRIRNAEFFYNSKLYKIESGGKKHAVHGGAEGFSHRNWEVIQAEKTQLTFRLISPDGDQGFPGDVTVIAKFAVNELALILSYDIYSENGTVCSVTNHAYWNLNGHSSGTIENHIISVYSNHRLETDSDNVPTGRVLSVEGTNFNLKKPKRIREILSEMDKDEELREKHGVDCTYVYTLSSLPDVVHDAKVFSEESGICMDVYSNFPSVQAYTGQNLPYSLKGKQNAQYAPYAGICLETQCLPDSPNHCLFPGTAILPGEHVRYSSKYAFSLIE